MGIYRHTTVGDNTERIVDPFTRSLHRSALVITTGGLGPTSDDLTNACLSTLTGREMVEYPEAREHVDEMFQRFGRKPTANNYKQAMFPEGTELIPNPVGTAMGALVEWEGTLFATLPGVPMEMKSMFGETLEPLIRARSDGSIVSKTLHFAGIGESALAEKVQDFLDATDPTVAPLAGQGRVRLRITTRAATEEEAQEKIAPVEKEVIARLSDYFFGEDDETLEGAVGACSATRRNPGPRRELHGRPARQAPDGHAGVLSVLHGGPRHLLQRGQGAPARGAARPALGARRRLRSRRPRDGRGRAQDLGRRLRALRHRIAGPDGGTEEKPSASSSSASPMRRDTSRRRSTSPPGRAPGTRSANGAPTGPSTSSGSASKKTNLDDPLARRPRWW